MNTTTLTLNALAQEFYGKDYGQLPDDGAQQDHVQHEYARRKQERREKLEAVNPVCSDLSDGKELNENTK